MAHYYCDKMIVCIGGESGTGKTEIASLIQEDLWYKHKVRCKIIHEDDYYFTRWQDRNTIRKKKGISSVGIPEIDWEKLQKICKAFHSKNKWLHIQRIHKYTNSTEEAIVHNNKIDILIIEGLYANYCSCRDLGFYLDGTYKETKNFREERKKEIINSFRMKVLEKEHKDVLKTKKDVIVIPYDYKNFGKKTCEEC
jgi:uridine kinase